MIVTCFIPAYNRGYCIERTIDAMLDLEIPKGWEIEYLWSDDNSTDNTWDIILNKAEEARQGRHIVVTNRNSKNLRQGRHVEKIMHLGHGEWFVEFDSDDIPCKDRLLQIAKRLQEHPQMLGYSSGVNICDGKKPISYSGVSPNCLFACGATCAWHKDIFAKFPSITEGTGSQDIFIPFRALLLGGEWIFDDTPTVNYGIDDTNDSTPRGLGRVESLRHLARLKRNWIMALSQRLHDLAFVSPNDLLFAEELRSRHTLLIEHLEKDILRLNFIAEYLESSVLRKLSMLCTVPNATGLSKGGRLKLLGDLLGPVGEFLLFCKSRLKKTSPCQSKPTGMDIAVTLDYLRDKPQEFLMML